MLTAKGHPRGVSLVAAERDAGHAWPRVMRNPQQRDIARCTAHRPWMGVAQAGDRDRRPPDNRTCNQQATSTACIRIDKIGFVAC